MWIKRIRGQWDSKIPNSSGGVIGQSRICKSVKHQRRSSSAKVCGVPLDDWANGGYADGIFTCGELVLVLWEAGPMRSNGYGI